MRKATPDEAVCFFAAQKLSAIAKSPGRKMADCIEEMSKLCIELGHDSNLHEFYMLHYSRKDLEELGESLHLKEVTLKNIFQMETDAVTKFIESHGSNKFGPA